MKYWALTRCHWRATGRREEGPGGDRAHEGSEGQLLTVRAAAQRLRGSTATVYGLCARGQLPHVRISNAIRIAPADLAAYVAQQRQRER